jgi:hypothetical protein
LGIVGKGEMETEDWRGGRGGDEEVDWGVGLYSLGISNCLEEIDWA